MMNDRDFEALWEKAEARSHAARLEAEYPAWRRKSRRTLSMVAGVAVVALAMLPVLQTVKPTDYERVYCNRTGTADAEWASLAADMLTTDMI